MVFSLFVEGDLAEGSTQFPLGHLSRGRRGGEAATETLGGSFGLKMFNIGSTVQRKPGTLRHAVAVDRLDTTLGFPAKK